MLPQMTPNQRTRANTLIRRLCANYMNGECVMLDCECPQMISYTVLCKYFKKAVLPVDKMLYAEVCKEHTCTTKCQRCGVQFIPNNNLQKYCIECRKYVCREQARFRKQKQRYMSRNEG